jgi:hypothetical protein
MRRKGLGKAWWTVMGGVGAGVGVAAGVLARFFLLGIVCFDLFFVR